MEIIQNGCKFTSINGEVWAKVENKDGSFPHGKLLRIASCYVYKTERFEQVTITCLLEQKEQAEEFCRANGYNLVQMREETHTENGGTFCMVAHKDITHELTVDDYMGMVAGDAWAGDGEL